MIIENKKLKLLFDGGDGVFRLSGLVNRSVASTVRFGRGSEEFVLSLRVGKKDAVLPASKFLCVGVEEHENYRGAMIPENKFVYSAVISYVLDTPAVYGLSELKVDVNYYADEKTGTVKKYLEITAPKTCVLNYFELGRYVLQDSFYTFSVAEPKKESHIPTYIAALGQPVYVESVFMGAEFPTADNKIIKGVTCFRVELKKPFSELAGDEKIFSTDELVIGAGDGVGYRAVNRAFFEYIREIARPVELRVQYNGWYDHMLDVSYEKLHDTFFEIAKGFKDAGHPTLDCYVVDDGWVDYKNPEFWAFDKIKFPNGFEELAKFTKEELKSAFGVWFSPRGGYTENFEYAKLLSASGYGINKRGKDICAAHKKYIADLSARILQFLKEYDVQYLKLDGFAAKACTDKNHGHIYGNDIAFYTDLWKTWLDAFLKLRAEKPELFINLTSYSHPSPWFLKWVDALWIGNSSDMSFSGAGSDVEQAITYRDGRYFDLFKTRDMQIPQAYLYNHEPCYAVKNVNFRTKKELQKPIEYTPAEFEKYMYMTVMRGTGLNELYFSPEKLDRERYQICADVLKFARYNFDILKKCIFFGGNAEKGQVYGYRGAEHNKGLLLVRNPGETEQPFILDQEGIAEMFGEYAGYEITEIYPSQSPSLAYGNGSGGYRVNLKPFEIKIFEIVKEFSALS